MFSKKNPVLSTAVLKVKNVYRVLLPESMPFEDYISSSNTSIKIDFPDGKSMMEKEFRKNTNPIQKFYLEFYDDISIDHIMDYLVNSDSNYRVTDMDGTILRLSQEDQRLLSSVPKKKDQMKLKEFVIVEEKNSIFRRFKNRFQKKDN